MHMDVLPSSIYVHHLCKGPVWARGVNRFLGTGVRAAVCEGFWELNPSHWEEQVLFLNHQVISLAHEYVLIRAPTL